MSMTDLELLEAAAKAAGIALVPYTWDKGAPWGEHQGFTVQDQGPDEWDPLTDDGQALRLAVACGISVEQDASIETGTFTYCGVTEGEYSMGVEAWRVSCGATTAMAQEIYGADKAANTRRSIVRAAAAMLPA
jgi:hypothetical protein